MLGEGGSEWSVVELYSDYAANRSHNVLIPECYGATKTHLYYPPCDLWKLFHILYYV